MADLNLTGARVRKMLAAAGVAAVVAGAAGCTTAPREPAAVAQPPAAEVRIDQAVGQREARLPCNRGASPVCDLRIYHVMVSSFRDGAPGVQVRDAWGPGPHTGDIRGVILELDRIKSLGFNAVWLTPVFDSRAGEPQQRADGTTEVELKLDGSGYFARDYFKVDPQFGTLADLEELARAARARGMGLILDGVLGHHKGAAVPSPSGLVPADSKIEADYPGQIAGYPGVVTDWRQPVTRAFYAEMMLYWTRHLGLTGWRLDQAYQVPADGWAELEPQVAAASQAAGGTGAMIGEVWGSAEELMATFGTNEAPGLSSLFDFPTRYALVQALAGDESGKRGPLSAVNDGWAMGAHQRYPDHAIPALMVGNHDLVRFGDLIERAGLGGPDSEGYWARHRLVQLFMLAWSGPVTVFYGEEYGAEMPGFARAVRGACWRTNRCDDHVARMLVNLSPADSRAQALAGSLNLALRDRIPALARGARTHLFSDATGYLDLKTAPGSCAVLALNSGTTARSFVVAPAALESGGTVDLASARVVSGGGTVVAENGALRIELGGLEGAVIELTCS